MKERRDKLVEEDAQFKETSDNFSPTTPPTMPPKKVGLTALQKYELYCLQAEQPQMKLADFALLEKCPHRPNGQPLAI